eukprot:scaffold5685_cov159-Pinguiococcus_pyrenoidosus.AAC.1
MAAPLRRENFHCADLAGLARRDAEVEELARAGSARRLDLLSEAGYIGSTPRCTWMVDAAQGCSSSTVGQA